MSDDSDEEAHVLLGRYRVLRTLGKGGFGVTYCAVDGENGDEVAVKALDLSRVDDWKAVELFEREAQILEQLDHPNIPRYLDFVPVQDESTGYLVQSLAPGSSLEELLAGRGRFTDQQLEGIAERTLKILVYLESLNPPVVHRDIKPANLLLDDEECVHLVDFGAVQDAAKRTTEGGSTVAGTFGYMAPEQLHGVATPRSDLYALGMTLIHLASGRHPTDFDRTGLKIDFHDGVDLPPELEAFIDRLVEPNPDDRFESARQALAHLQEEVPVSPDLTELPSGPSVRELVLDREREREQELQRKRADRQRYENKALEQHRKTVQERADRVNVRMTPDELHLEIAPDRTPAFKTASKFAMYAWVVLLAPVLMVDITQVMSQSQWLWILLSRFLVLGAVAFLLSFLGAFLLTPKRHIRLSREGEDGFYATGWRDPERAQQVGRFENFEVQTFARETGWPEEAVEITLTDERGELVFREKFENLSARDVDRLDELPTEWLKPEKHDSDRQSNDEDVVFDLDDPISGTSLVEDTSQPVDAHGVTASEYESSKPSGSR